MFPQVSAAIVKRVTMSLSSGNSDDGGHDMKQLLSDGIEDYLGWRSSQDYGASTLVNEKVVLKRFLTVTGNIYINNVTARHVTRHFEEASKTRQPSTLKLDHSYLGLFFDWARQTKRMGLDNDPMHGRRKPKGVKRERNRINVSRFPYLLDVAEKSDPRNRALVSVLLYTLLRDQEAASLKIGDIDLDGGWIIARIAKSHTEDRMPICSELDAELRRWLTIYTEQCGLLSPQWFLLPQRKSVGVHQDDSGKITGHTMRYFPEHGLGESGRVVRPILEAFGFPVTDHAGRSLSEGSHTLRRSGARALFDSLSESGYDHSLRIVQSMLHHSSIATTEGYIGVSADRRTRDEILRGKPMYRLPSVSSIQVAQ